MTTTPPPPALRPPSVTLRAGQAYSDRATTKASADVCAAASDLRHALEQLANAAEARAGVPQRYVQAARAALARARGPS